MVTITKERYRAWIVFTLPATIGKKIELSGSWNGWKKEPMKLKKSGEFRIIKILKLHNHYEFGYLIDGKNWIYDQSLETTPTQFHSYNSLLEI